MINREVNAQVFEQCDSQGSRIWEFNTTVPSRNVKAQGCLRVLAGKVGSILIYLSGYQVPHMFKKINLARRISVQVFSHFALVP